MSLAFAFDQDELFRDPLAAARQAEEAFRLAHSLPSPHQAHSWQLLCRAVHGRILSLSDFHLFDVLIRYAERHMPLFSSLPQLTPSLRDEVQVAMFGMLVFRQPGHPRIAEHARRCERIVAQHGYTYVRLTAANYLVLYRTWRGDLLGAEALRQSMSPLRQHTREPHALLMSYSIDAMVRRLFLNYDACEEAVAAGLSLAEESGVHVWDSHFHMQRAYLALSRNNLNQAHAHLEQMLGSAPPSHYLDRAGYHFCRAWYFHAADDMRAALRHARWSVANAQRAGALFPLAVTRMGLAQLHLGRGLPHLALWHMGRVGLTGRGMASRGMPFAQGLVRASLALRLGLEGRASAVLRKTLALGRAEQYLNFPWWRNEAMAELCALALREGIEPDYVQQLIHARRLRPPTAEAPPGWRRPLRIDLLQSRLHLDGSALVLPVQEQALLLALAEAGGSESAVGLAHRLWPSLPEAEAMALLAQTATALRGRLGSEQMLRGQGERWELDPGLVEWGNPLQ